MYQVVFNDENKVQVKEENNVLFIEGQPMEWDLKRISDNIYHIISNNKSYTLEIRKEEGKIYHVKLNGKAVTASIKDKLDLLLEKLGLDATDSGKLQVLKAPMPGLIVEIKVNVGDEVKKGDQLLILEAMKMENMIKSPGEGTVKAINVKKGDGVEKNQVMIQFS